ncbi:MAG: prenyltransferase, partial [Methanomassiliicoccales archaeon]
MSGDALPRWRALLTLGRVYMLLPGLLLYTLGWEVALSLGAAWDMGRFLLGYAAFILPHLSVSYSDDYFDLEGDRLGHPAGISGGSGVLVRSPQLAPLALLLAKLLLAGGMLLALLFVIAFPSSWIMLPLFVIGGLLGWYYSAPPVRLTARRLSEVATAVGVGVIMPLAGFLCSGAALAPGMVLLLVPLVCFALCFILSVEMPDREADMASGKASFISRYGLDAGSHLAAATAVLGTVSLLLLGQLGSFLPVAMTRLGLLSIIPTII